MNDSTPAGQLVLAARMLRRRELNEQLRSLMVGREPETGDEFAAWCKQVEVIRLELKILGER